MALLKGQEMGRFKLGSTVIGPFAPGRISLVEQLQDLSVAKTGQSMAISAETFMTLEVEPVPLAEEEIGVEHDASPLAGGKKDEG